MAQKYLNNNTNNNHASDYLLSQNFFQDWIKAQRKCAAVPPVEGRGRCFSSF